MELISQINGTRDYYEIGYLQNIDLSSDISLDFKISAGYQVSNEQREDEDEYVYIGASAWKDISTNLTLNIGHFNLGLNAVFRQDGVFYDEDIDDPETRQDEARDFKVTELKSDESDEQKSLPKTIFWFSIGYTSEF